MGIPAGRNKKAISPHQRNADISPRIVPLTQFQHIPASVSRRLCGIRFFTLDNLQSAIAEMTAERQSLRYRSAAPS
jgi:hypothetical protein